MGASVSVQTAVTNIVNTMETEMDQQVNASSTTTCSIKFKSFKMINGHNCMPKLVNKCNSDAKGTLKANIDAILKVINAMDVNQKAEAASYFTLSTHVATDVQNITNAVKTYLKQKCETKSHLTNEIVIDTFEYTGCWMSEPGTMLFLNTGQAVTNCVMDIVMKTALDAQNDIKIKQSSGMDWSKLIWPIAIAVSVVAAVGAILLFVRTFISKAIMSASEKRDNELAKQGKYSANVKSLRDNSNSIDIN